MRTFATRLVRVCLWLLLVVGPIGYCLLFIVSDLMLTTGAGMAYSDIYIAGQALSATSEEPNPFLSWLQWLVFTLMGYSPVLFSCLAIAFLLLLGYWSVRAIRKLPFLPISHGNWHLAQQLLGCLMLTYVVGSIMHLSSSHWLKQGLFPEKYLWPYYGWPVAVAQQEGWTIYPPLSTLGLLLPEGRAACIKLGVLLALLVGRHFWLRWSQKQLQALRTNS